MSKKILLIAITSLLCAGCATNTLSQHEMVFKKWHISPSGDPLVSTFYPVISWETVQKIKIGMDEIELEQLIHDVQNYHHRINAIVFTESPDGIKYEVAIKLSEDSVVEDLSFKIITF